MSENNRTPRTLNFYLVSGLGCLTAGISTYILYRYIKKFTSKEVNEVSEVSEVNEVNEVSEVSEVNEEDTNDSIKN